MLYYILIKRLIGMVGLITLAAFILGLLTHSTAVSLIFLIITTILFFVMGAIYNRRRTTIFSPESQEYLTDLMNIHMNGVKRFRPKLLMVSENTAQELLTREEHLQI